MDSSPLREQIIRELDNLSEEQQEYLLDIARRLQKSTLPPGTPGEVLQATMDQFEFAPGAVDDMMRVIEEDCGRIDWSGWQ